MHSKDNSEWRKVSRDIHEWASSLEVKSHTWNKSCKDSAKREGAMLKLVEMAANETMRSKKMKRGTTSTSSSNNCAKKEKRKMKLVLFWKK